jgi:hypothetical protein
MVRSTGVRKRTFDVFIERNCYPDADQYIKKNYMRPRAVHFNELNGHPLHIYEI